MGRGSSRSTSRVRRSRPARSARCSVRAGARARRAVGIGRGRDGPSSRRGCISSVRCSGSGAGAAAPPSGAGLVAHVLRLRPAAFLYGVGLGVGFLTYLTHGTLVVVAVAAVASGRPLSARLCSRRSGWRAGRPRRSLGVRGPPRRAGRWSGGSRTRPRGAGGRWRMRSSSPRCSSPGSWRCSGPRRGSRVRRRRPSCRSRSAPPASRRSRTEALATGARRLRPPASARAARRRRGADRRARGRRDAALGLVRAPGSRRVRCSSRSRSRSSSRALVRGPGWRADASGVREPRLPIAPRAERGPAHPRRGRVARGLGRLGRWGARFPERCGRRAGCARGARVGARRVGGGRGVDRPARRGADVKARRPDRRSWLVGVILAAAVGGAVALPAFSASPPTRGSPNDTSGLLDVREVRFDHSPALRWTFESLRAMDGRPHLGSGTSSSGPTPMAMRRWTR